MVNIAICDDDKTIISIIERMLDKIMVEKNIKINYDVFFDSFSLIKNMKEGIYYDIIYLNIEMQINNGINTTNTIKSINNSSYIIYISNHGNYIKELFNTDPVLFLAKPLDAESFYSIFRFAYEKIQQHKDYFFYTYNKSFFKVPLKYISYFESKNRIIYIHTYKSNTNQSLDRFYGKLNNIEKKLCCSNLQFLRIHQSYLVNFDFIKCMNFTEAQLLDGTLLQISEYKQKKVLNMFCSMAGTLYND